VVSSNSSHIPNAVIYGCSGPVLSGDEKRFFADARPAGFILFERNCQNPDQVRALVQELLDCIGQAQAPILIDQEGGRVQRLKPPHWRDAPPPAVFKVLAGLDQGLAVEAARLNAQLIAAELLDVGITVNCAPVLDVPGPGSHEIIGDRAFGDDPATVSALGLATAEGFLSMGVLPVIKHIPGHGRAKADSHHDLPLVDASMADLESVDFPSFRALRHMPWAMTAHVVYAALDKAAPATTSALVISDAIRGTIGFDGVLVSDDLSMKALAGSMQARAEAALAAGCDLVLHCCGDMVEMQNVAQGVASLSNAAAVRLARGEDMLGRLADWDGAAALARLNDILKPLTPEVL
jgi:beta-N-acetylhexosaminidase